MSQGAKWARAATDPLWPCILRVPTETHWLTPTQALLRALKGKVGESRAGAQGNSVQVNRVLPAGIASMDRKSSHEGRCWKQQGATVSEGAPEPCSDEGWG